MKEASVANPRIIRFMLRSIETLKVTRLAFLPGRISGSSEITQFWYKIAYGTTASTHDCGELCRLGLLPSRFWRAVVAVTFSVALQTAFVISAARNAPTLDHSLRFAIFGIPACVLAIFLAVRAHGKWRARVTISASVGLVIWAVLITLHQSWSNHRQLGN